MVKDMPFDTGYTLGPTQMLSNDFTLSGYLKTKIAFDNITDAWVIQMPDIIEFIMLIPLEHV